MGFEAGATDEQGESAGYVAVTLEQGALRLVRVRIRLGVGG